MKAIVVHEIGGPEQLKLEDRPDPTPGAGEALVQIESIGVNFIDVYYRKGLYPGKLPLVPGMEAAGVVTAIGSDVTEVQVGERVAYAGTLGAYAEKSVVPSKNLVQIPEGVTSEQAAAVMLQGMTAHYLTHSTFPLEPGDICLLHAAAGGVGLILVQIAKALGATVIGTVGTDEKAELAREAGADHVINYSTQDFVAEVKRLTDNVGVDVVYDSVGAATFDRSLDCLRPRGMMVTFGNASGPVPPMAPLLLNQKGSLFLTRPKLADYTATREDLLDRANDLFDGLLGGDLQLRMEHEYPLADAAQAHKDLEARQTTGKVLLKV